MEALTDMAARIEAGAASLMAWERMPDLPLYRDQVIYFMGRQFSSLGADRPLTGAMVNNYIKEGLLPRAVRKQYTREHLAYLSAICLLKQVLPVRDVRDLMTGVLAQGDIRALYECLRGQVAAGLTRAARALASGEGVAAFLRGTDGESTDGAAVTDGALSAPTGVLPAPDGALSATTGVLPAPDGALSAPTGVPSTAADTARLALTLAVDGFCRRVVCDALLQFMREQAADGGEGAGGAGNGCA